MLVARIDYYWIGNYIIVLWVSNLGLLFPLGGLKFPPFKLWQRKRSLLMMLDNEQRLSTWIACNFHLPKYCPLWRRQERQSLVFHGQRNQTIASSLAQAKYSFNTFSNVTTGLKAKAWRAAPISARLWSTSPGRFGPY